MKLIDIGCFNGDTPLHFIAYPDIDSIDAYDPNKDFTWIWDAIHHVYPQINFFSKAVYTHHGTEEFNKRPKDNPLGSTLSKDKHDWHEGKKIFVSCVDILDIIPNEKFCLKVDVEGAEYDILERLMGDKRAEHVDRLYVEWHDRKMSSDNSQRQRKIENFFGERLRPWA